MDNRDGVLMEKKRWRFHVNNKDISAAADITVRAVLNALAANLNQEDERRVVPLAHGDPSSFPCFRTTPVAEDAVVDALRSGNYNHYAPTVGLLPGRRAIADYLNLDLPYKLSPDDVFLTLGCVQAIDIALKALARPGANILLPRPGFPYYEACASQSHLDIRHFDLLPESGWEVDLEAVESMVDDNTVGMVIINPGNPCGSVYSYEHLKKVAETAKKLGILVIADEVYGHITFGSNRFVPMGVFGSIVPVLTLGSISKRWVVPGWRLGWLVTSDPNGIIQDSGVVASIKDFLNISSDPVTFIQGAIPQLIKNTDEDFFLKINNILREAADVCYEGIQSIPCITCPQRPEGSMFVMVKLNLLLLEGIKDDMDFCLKLVREESVMVLPGIVLGMKEWLRITFAVERAVLEDGLGRIKAFCERHAKSP